MTLDELLTEYEHAWRAMDLAGVPQFYGSGADGIPGNVEPWATCAWVGRPLDDRLSRAAERIFVRWRCVEDGCDWRAGSLAHAIIHLNNRHHRTFAWFAKNFREAWQQGIAA